MRIQIIQLEHYDDVISTRDKLSWAKTARVLLVWPKGGKLLRRRLDLVILLRTSQSLGTHLGLVTHDREVRMNAAQVGLPVFSTVKQAQRKAWRRGRGMAAVVDREHPRPDFKALRSQTRFEWPRWMQRTPIRLGFFSIGLLAFLLLALAFVPSAGIVVVPNTQLQQMTLQVFASRDVKSVNIAGNLPAHTITGIVDGQKQVKTSGQVEIPDGFAVGEVQFSNLTDQTVMVAAGTTLQTIDSGHRRYIVTQAGNVSAGAAKTLVLPIQAILPGADGNVGSGAIQAIEGPIGLHLAVNNLAPIVGGHNRLSSGVSQDDLISLRQQLQDELQISAIREMESRLSEGDRLIPKTVEIKNILEEKSEPEVNQPGDYLTLSLRVEFAGVYLSGADLHSFSSATMDIALPAGFQPVPGSFQVDGIGIPEVKEDQTIHWNISAHRMVRRNLSEDQLVNLVAGLTPEQARKRLAHEVPLGGDPRFLLNPKWWPQLPIFPFRISVFYQS
jgi:hypothetical protein